MSDDFLQQVRAVLRSGHILSDADAARYQENCLSLHRRILVVIQPENETEVVAIVKTANQHRIALYTVSTGHNWGYGSSLPVVDGCAILDLSRMSRIIDFDAELGLVTLEPGVTQQQLMDYLVANHLDFYVPTTGAGPTTSIVGNALEHGFGMTPEEDHFQAVTSVRAVLAGGEIYQSCFTEMGAPAAGVWKWGIGPYLDGLFAQANMGIVTALQIALAPRAEHTELYLFTLKREENLPELLAACKTLLADMKGPVGSIKLLNRQQYESTLDDDQKGKGVTGDFAWMGFGVVRCRKSMIGSLRKEIRRSLKPQCSRLMFINDRRIGILRNIISIIPEKMKAMLALQLQRLEYLMALVNGVPRADALRLAYQHVKMPAPEKADPARDGVGILWYAPTIPMKPQLILSMIAMIGEVTAKHGFKPTITFTISSGKCAIGVVAIVYKRPEGAQQAQACYRELWERGNALGCPPYRINVDAMAELTGNPDSVYWNSVGKIKTALDPNHILSPGRYAPAG